MNSIGSNEARDLCLSLLRADTEDEVLSLLQKYGYWDDPAVWRYYGDKEDNFATIGNQQSAPDAALVEKIVNSVDAVLMGECWSRGMSPDDPQAPRSIAEAVALYLWGDGSKVDTFGHISYWGPEKRRELSNRITMAATGTVQSPCFTISDSGEGQTPESMPKTLLSLDQKNKINVHFVQGKFNMGGTGALQFCGHHNLQLVISRRKPGIPSRISADDSLDEWGFVIVRREDPTGSRKVSTYTYLAPLNADKAPRQGDVLRFKSDTIPFLPNGNDGYAREAGWGTAIKLYEYEATGFKSHILRRDGLLYRLDILLPEVALPFRLHECRPNYKGHPGSFDTPLTGLGVRLDDDRAGNLEDGFPTTSPVSISGQQMTAKIFAFKRGKADTYRKNEGLIFVVNGQTHGHLTRSFFSRKQVGMNRLEDSILVMVDCSRISRRTIEDLFMNSRDRLRSGETRDAIEQELESIIRNHQGLRDLREKRRREDVESKLQDSKPMKEILESILRKSPSLAALFAGSGPLSNPFKAKEVEYSDKRFKGKKQPTYFKFRGLDYGQELIRETPITMRSRIVFETDAVNDYFDRNQYPDRFTLDVLTLANTKRAYTDYTLNPWNGIVTLNVKLPPGVSLGNDIQYEARVTDATLIEPFVNRFTVKVKPEQKPSGGRSTGRKRGKGDENGHKREIPQGLAIPEPVLVFEEDWGKHRFDKYSALKVVHDPTDDEDSADTYTYYVNMDNIYLKTELKATKETPEIVKARWQYGLMLIGMALLRDDIEAAKDTNGAEPLNTTNGEVTIEDKVFQVTAAVAPVLLPLIDSLGALSEEDLATTAFPA